MSETAAADALARDQMKKPRRRSIFASKSVPEHLVRGAGAAVLIVIAVWLWGLPGVFALVGAAAALGGAIVLMRGCPTCWFTGLCATISDRPGGCTPTRD